MSRACLHLGECTYARVGSFRCGTLMVDRKGVRLGVRLLRDPYTAKPTVLFTATKRVGGGVQDFDAFQLVETAAG